MKKLQLLFVFCLVSSIMFAQQTNKERKKILDAAYSNLDQSSSIDKSSVKKNKRDFAIGKMDQTKWIIESLDKYRKERLTALIVGIGGAGIACGSLAIQNDSDLQVSVQIVGGALILVSYIATISAERHLSKKNLTFTGNGMILRF